MRKICEWSKCKEIASGEGLIKKDINKQYKWFCGDHLKIHNKTNDNSCDWKRCKQAGEFKAPSKTVGEFLCAWRAENLIDSNRMDMSNTLHARKTKKPRMKARFDRWLLCSEIDARIEKSLVDLRIVHSFALHHGEQFVEAAFCDSRFIQSFKI